MDVISTRPARPADLSRLCGLLTEWCGPSAVPSPTHLAHAVTHGLVQVAEADGALVGCAAAEVPSAAHVRLFVIAVHPGNRRRGLASRLLREILERAPDRPQERSLVSAVAGTRELEVMRFLLARGFIGTRTLRTGTDAELLIHYQYKLPVEYIDPDARHLVPVAASEQLVDSLAPADQAVTALVELAGLPAFEIARFERDDPASLQSGEAAAGIAFSGSLLAAITFILGFSFTSSRFPDDVRLLLIGATFSTMLSLIVYASASGELARIRANSFGRIMKWGNVLSEYGGVLPFLISLPVTYAEVSRNPWTTMVLAALLSGAIIGYERSEFSIAHRFRHNRAEVALMALTGVSPGVGAAMVAVGTVTWPWTAVLAATLALRTWLYLARQGAEAGIAEHRRRWQIRA
ncbi:GNAT family N-acetyltransferase [Streptomyces sp. NPDC001034]|uniref:GNAT family N-acetyltransferase n=1 Tax=Streptomyces sp. NPDC001034 TaxID=3154375 RepID=UPI00331D597E